MGIPNMLAGAGEHAGPVVGLSTLPGVRKVLRPPGNLKI